jgi:rRNA-processing protein CGR1
MAKPKTRPTRREPTYAAVAKPVAVEAPPAAPAPAPPPAAVDVRGRNVSGRPWKQPPKSRSSSLKMTQPRKSWDAKKRDREARQRAREKEAELVEARKERIAEQKRKTEEKRSRKRRNEFRNAQYQVITNDKTVKSLSKKKLRQIKRTRVAADGEVELVDAYAPMHGPRAKRVRGKK